MMAHLEYNSSTTTKTTGLPVEGAYHRGGKRWLDILLALALLPFLAPVIFVLALINAAHTGSPVFGHTRLGQNGRRFRCWKLRTMYPNSEDLLAAHLAQNPSAAAEWESVQKLTNDPRVTPFGHFLRRASLDELPQIWNVLCGEMSFVGPRPITHSELSRYGAYAREYLSVKPGVTGLWQVYGRTNGCYKERVRLDTNYCRSISIYRDLALIGLTALVLLKATGK